MTDDNRRYAYSCKKRKHGASREIKLPASNIKNKLLKS